MVDEMASLHKNEAWDLVELSAGRKPIGSKWVFKKKIKVLRTDNGGEFCSRKFEEFCKKCGIAWQKTTPYTPQQNGVAERMNKMLMERARSMLSGARL